VDVLTENTLVPCNDNDNIIVDSGTTTLVDSEGTKDPPISNEHEAQFLGLYLLPYGAWQFGHEP
jgi:hypothetical protein